MKILLLFSGLRSLLDLKLDTNASAEHTASILRADNTT
jgi:hypothetical protein